MSRFAEATHVPVERTRAEIEEMLQRYGAGSFTSGWDQVSHMIAFRRGGLLIRFVMPMPSIKDDRFVFRVNKRTNKKERRTEQQAAKEWEQERRQRFRALKLVIQAKLEAVECGISTMEQEFLAFIVGADDRTLGDWIIDRGRLQCFVAGKEWPKMLEGPAPSGEVIDAEIVGGKNNAGG